MLSYPVKSPQHARPVTHPFRFGAAQQPLNSSRRNPLIPDNFQSRCSVTPPFSIRCCHDPGTPPGSSTPTRPADHCPTPLQPILTEIALSMSFKINTYEQNRRGRLPALPYPGFLHQNAQSRPSTSFFFSYGSLTTDNCRQSGHRSPGSRNTDYGTRLHRASSLIRIPFRGRMVIDAIGLTS